MLFACYRKDEAVNPEIYAAAIGAVLSEYPDDVVLFVTDPRTGIASKSKWLPAVSEVKEACDLEVERLAGAAKRERDLAEQLAERNRYEAEQVAKANHPTLFELEAKLGRPIGNRKFMSALPPTLPGDGRHAERVAKDLAERAARRTNTEAS